MGNVIEVQISSCVGGSSGDKAVQAPTVGDKNAPLPTFLPKPSDGAVKSMITAGGQVLLASQKMNHNSLDKFAKCLAHLSGTERISKSVFQKHVFPQDGLASDYIWSFFTGYSNLPNISISDAQFTRSAEQIFAQITDKEQVNFYIKVFGKGKDTIGRSAFMDFLMSAFEVSSSPTSSTAPPPDVALIEDGKIWLEAVTKSCFHLKDDVSSYFIASWLLTNLPRILIPLHKYIAHQLTTGYTQLTAATSSQTATPGNGTEANVGGFLAENSGQAGVQGINPILLWLLSSSLPNQYIGILLKKAEPPPCPFTTMMSPKQLLQQLLNETKVDPERWTMLYNSAEDGTSINRFQFHVFNYRGPSIMFIYADNGYTMCIASDSEWKESCHFWGGEDAVLMQLQPEFRLVERGPKMLYANYSIRGYPFGIQVGQDPRNVSVEVKPDFQYVSFKKIPCRINQIVVYGCAPKQAKSSQSEYQKWEAKQCEKQRVVKRNTGDWGDNPDKYLLELAGSYKSYGNGNN